MESAEIEHKEIMKQKELIELIDGDKKERKVKRENNKLKTVGDSKFLGESVTNLIKEKEKQRCSEV